MRREEEEKGGGKRRGRERAMSNFAVSVILKIRGGGPLPCLLLVWEE
jgi:hypothetical protein